MRGREVSGRYRWAVASRVIAAAAGGYGLTWVWTLAVALAMHRVWSAARIDAALIAATVGPIVYATAVLVVFCARSATRAWVALLLAAVLPSLAVGLLYG